jgi:hypothetical protein
VITMDTTQHESAVVGVHWLLELDFSGGTSYLTTAPLDVDTGAHIYVSKQIAVSSVSESEDASAERVTISVPVVDSSILALVLGAATTYRGRAARLYLQLFDAEFVPTGSPVLRWSGYMEPVRITRKTSNPEQPGGGTGRIEMSLQRAGMARARNNQGQRHTHQQQSLRYPGDLGLEYMQALIEAPALWLSKRFQEV